MMRLLFVLDDLASLNFDKDSSVDLMRHAVRRGWEVDATNPRGLTLEGQSLAASCLAIAGICEAGHKSFGDFDVVLMRIDPPITMAFVATCQLLALQREAPVINDPLAVISRAEKLFPRDIAGVFPDTIVTSNFDAAAEFRDRWGTVVLKPLYDYCGSGIYVSDSTDKNLRSVFDSLIRQYAGVPLMVQEYLPAIDQGDRRVFVVNGRPVAAINRRLARDDHRANMMVGGEPEAYSLTSDEVRICEQVGEVLAKSGIYLAGLDLIGDRVTEVNCTAATGFVQARELTGVDVAEIFLTWLSGKYVPR